MRERLSSKFVTFTKILGKDFYGDLFEENGKPKLEETIESIYNLQHMKATNFAVEITKERAPIRGKTDGYGKVILMEKGRRIVNFKVLQEVKRNIRRFCKEYEYQIKQGLLYWVQFNGIKVIVFPSTNYIDYMFIDENEDILESLRDTLLSNLKEYSPCNGCQALSFNISDLKLHHVDMPTPADISKMWHDIICHCIDI